MIRNYNILRLHTNPDKLYTERSFANKSPKILTDQRTIPPFQVIRPTLSNSPVTKFELTRLETGAKIDILTEALAGPLSIQYGGTEENYAETSLTPYTGVTGKSAWGFSLGVVDLIRHCYITIYCSDFDNIPTKFEARIRESKGGTIINTSSEVTIIPDFKTNTKVYFDFGSVYDNTTNNIYLEVKADGVWTPVGNDSLYTTGQTVSFKTYGASVYAYPDTDNSPTDEGSGRAVVYAYAGNYDIIVNDGTTFDKYVPEGEYTLEMSDGRYTWYSEKFEVKSYVNDKVTITYWHNEPFNLPLGVMRYFDGYKNKIIFDAKLRKPEYPQDEEVSQRDGVDLPIWSASKKQMTMKVYASEFMLDAMRLIWQHHNIQIENEWDVFTVDEFNITDIDWDREGYIAEVTIEFTVHVPTPIDLGSSRSICEGESLTLDAGISGMNYSWNTGSTNQSISVNTTGKYLLEVIDQENCSVENYPSLELFLNS